MTDAPTLDVWAETLRRSLTESSLTLDASLRNFTTYRVGGTAAVLAEVGSPHDLEALGAAIRSEGLASVVVGRGSNLLVADAGFDGVVIVLGGRFGGLQFSAERVTAGAAVALPALARQTVKAGLAGFEWAVGVPGSVGGAVRMNAGGHGSDMAGSVESAQVYSMASGAWSLLDRDALEFGYRTSSIAPTDVVTEVTLALAAGDASSSQALLREIVLWRRTNQPGGQNAGSVFRNPDGTSAGELIDQAGLKGLRIGTAAVSDKHANFIQADPEGSADDVLAVMREVQHRVAAHAGIHLHPETVLVGFRAVDEEHAL